MRHLKLGFLVLAACAVVAAGTTATYAFHSGGVAECGGCHSMHSAPATAPYLLKGSDQSSACLNCHEGSPGSYHISTPDTTLATAPPTQHTPGGDFAWLKRDYAWSITRGTSTTNYTEAGEAHGHNIIAADYNYVQESDKDYGQTDPDTGEPILETAVAPGGTYSAANLGCQSCHDPHGEARILPDYTVAQVGAPIYSSGSYGAKPVPAGSTDPNSGTTGLAVGVYRILRSAGSTHDGVQFDAVPFAIVPSTYNRSEASTYTKVGYANGFGAWCAECHPGMDSAVHNVHPVDEDLGSGIAGIYNQYRGSGIMTGAQSTAYLSLVPFALQETLSSTGIDNLVTAIGNQSGPATNGQDQVMCLSCHRAHASGFVEGLRWQYEAEMIVIDGEWPATDATSTNAQSAKWSQGRDSAEILAAYNDIPASRFATYQRVLCNKCHAKD